MTAIDLPEAKLDPGAVRALSELRAPKFLATRDADGVPNVVPVLSLEAVDERTIVFGEMMIWKTRRNLEADPRVSILVLSPDLRTWTVRGRFVEFQRSGPYFDHVASNESARYNPYGSYRSAGVIEVLGSTRIVAVLAARPAPGHRSAVACWRAASRATAGRRRPCRFRCRRSSAG